MAKLMLEDGRIIPTVKPHLGDQLAVERALGMKPAEFRETLKTGSFQTAFVIFASLNRAGVKTTIQDVLAIDLEALGGLVEMEEGDRVAGDVESEGEQGLDPRPAPIADPGPATE